MEVGQSVRLNAPTVFARLPPVTSQVFSSQNGQRKNSKSLKKMQIYIRLFCVTWAD